MKHLSKVIFLLLLFFAPLVFAAPNPYINDRAGVLTEQQHQELTALVGEVEKNTTSELAVLIIPKLENETIEGMAVRIFQEWGIGKKDKDNGVLLLVSIGDRRLRIEVGYGLEGALTDLESSQIINDVITPQFKQNNYYQGIYDGLLAVQESIKTEYVPVVSEESDLSKIPFELIIFVIYLFFNLIVHTKSWWLGGVIGVFVGLINQSIVAALGYGLLGLLLDFVLSKIGQNPVVKSALQHVGFSGGRSGGGGIGFGGGRSGGGGSSGRW